MIYNTVAKPQPAKSTVEISIHISLEFFFIDFDIFAYTESYKIRPGLFERIYYFIHLSQMLPHRRGLL